jgi:hypothetical protein
MRVLHTALLAAGFAALMTAASAQTQPTVSPTSPAVSPAAGQMTTPAPAPEAADDAVTCRYEKTTGSLFAKRVCHTVREWKQMEQAAHDTLDRLDSGRQINPSGS